MPTLELAIDARRARTGQAQFESSARGIRRSARSIGTAVGRANIAIANVGVAARRAIGPLAGFASAFVGIAAAGAALKTIIGFEDTMATLRAVTSGTVEELEALEKTARELGATTRFSAVEAGEGLVFLARAGFTAGEAIAALPSTLDLAAAGAIELGEAADFASNILSAFGLSAEETVRVVDTLTKTANSSNTNIRQLAEAMKTVAPIAGALGIAVEETAAAIGVLGDSGIQASLAGTNLRGVIAALLKPTSEAKRAFSDLGISLEDIDPSTRSLTEIFQKFSEANLTAAEAVAIFGRRNASAALVITKSVDKLGELTEANREAGGTAREAARIMNDTLGGALLSLKSAVEELFIATGDKGLAGGLKDVTLAVTDAFRVLAGLEDKVEGNVTVARRLAAVFKVLGITVAAFIALKVVGVFTGMAVALLKATKAAVLLGFALRKSVLVPLLLIGVAVATFEIGAFLATEFEEGAMAAAAFANFLLGTMLVIEAILETAPKAFQAGWRVAIVAVVDLFDSFVKELINQVRVIENVFNAIAGASGGLIDPIDLTSGLESARQTISSQFDGIRSDMAELVTDVAKNVDELDRDLFNLTQVFVEQLGEIEKEFQDGQREDLSFAEFVERDFEALGESIKGILNSLGESEFAQQGIDAINTLLDELTDSILGASSALEDAADIDIGQPGPRGAADPAGARPTEGIADDIADIPIVAEEAIASMGLIEQAADDVGAAFGRAFESAIFDAKDLRDVALDLLKEISRAIFNTFVTQQISGAISSGISGLAGGGFAKGAAFHGGNVVAFQGGGTVDSPTFFPMSGGRTGLLGEAGPEAILPLARDSQGNLGVRADGAGGGGGDVVNVSINVQAQDVTSFRQSEAQITNSMSRAIAESFRRARR